MSDDLLVQLSPARVQLEPGGQPVEVSVTIQNRSDSPAEYAIELSGLQRDWYTAPPTSVRLFPEDRDQVRFMLRPPRSAGRGTYVYRIVVQAGPTRETAEGTLEITGTPAYRLELTPRRMTRRGSGTFQVQLLNTGTADVTLALEAQDAEGNCQLRFARDATVRVPAGQRVQVPLRVRPDQRPWAGSDRSYDFTVAARPDNSGVAPQTIPGQFTHHPRLASWAPIGRTLAIMCVLGLALVFVVTILPASMAGPVGKLRSGLCSVPTIDSLCGKPAPPVPCVYDAGFADYAATESELIGPCVTGPLSDPFGNVRQYTRNGMLFWQHDSNTDYFFKGDSLYGFFDGKSTLVHGSGAS
jgi:hypothetical protein